MSVETALYTRGQAVTALTDLISTRLWYWGSIPQNPTKPYVSFGRVSTVRYPTMGVTTGVKSCRFQFDAWALQQFSAGGVTGAAEVGDALATAFQRFRGDAGGVTFQDIFLESERDISPDLDEGPQSEGLFRRTLDFMVHWE